MFGSRRIQLRGGPSGSTSSAYFESDGTLTVEFYDHGAEAEAHFGHDVAYFVRVRPAQRPLVLAALAAATGGRPPRSDSALLRALAEKFASYFEVKQWLGEQRIPFETHFDSWA